MIFNIIHYLSSSSISGLSTTSCELISLEVPPMQCGRYRSSWHGYPDMWLLMTLQWEQKVHSIWYELEQHTKH